MPHRIASENVRRSREAVDRAGEGKQLHIYRVSGHKGFIGKEIAEEITKSVTHLARETEEDIQKSLRSILNEISESARRQSRVRGNALVACEPTKIKWKGKQRKHQLQVYVSTTEQFLALWLSINSWYPMLAEKALVAVSYDGSTGRKA